jgi:hypothetical protein
MAVNHMVWFKFYSTVAEERVAAHLQALRSLKTQVPGVIDLHVGVNFTDRANGYTHGLMALLHDKVALANYVVHPAHVAVVNSLQDDCDRLALDYEF